jgi:glycosyltransferase involved in cell wall biosynthesis
MGGTEYMFFLIASKLADRRPVTLYVTTPGSFPSDLPCIEVSGLAEAVDSMKARGEDVLVLRESEVLPHLPTLKVTDRKVIVWAHNFSGHRTLRACVQCPSIVRYLCVSREQYEDIRDEDVFRKADYVFNAMVTGRWPERTTPATEDNVFYMGSLIEAKGFHVLAQQWHRIAEAVPTARLHVVGTGRLYDRSAPVGSLGLASPEYERRFVPFLSRDGRLREDVTFHGNLGADKLEVLARAKVAVANPTGVGETFCITAVEFGLLGVPVVTKKVGGPVNVIEDGVTGLLYNRESQLAESVVRLLRDDDLRHRMGQAASNRVRALFDIEPVLRKWGEVLDQVVSGLPANPDLHILGIPKRWKEWNRRIRSLRGLQWLPSIGYWKHAWNKKKHSLVTKRLLGLTRT